MAKAKKGDFIEVEYTGTLKDNNFVFDTTDIEVAKANNLYESKTEFGPAIICLGQGQLLKGLEEEIEGKEIEKDLVIPLPTEKAFGKKDAKMIKMIPSSAFRKQRIEPQPGLPVNVDGMSGVIKTASGGRCLVDFNHPLSGKDVVYTVKILRIVADDAEKIKSFLKLSLRLKADVEVKEGKAEISIKREIPKEIQSVIEDGIKGLVKTVKSINFKVEKEEKK